MQDVALLKTSELCYWILLVLDNTGLFVVFLTVASFLTILAKPFSFSPLPVKLDFKILLAISCRCMPVHYLF